MHNTLYLVLVVLAISSLSLASEAAQNSSATDPALAEENKAGGVSSNKLLEVEGLIALQYDSSRGESGRFGTDPYATLGLTFTPLTPLEKVKLYTLLLQSRDFEVDESIVSLQILPNNMLDLSFGRQYLPFGSYDSEMISDPLTQVIGSIRGEEVLRIDTHLRIYPYLPIPLKEPHR